MPRYTVILEPEDDEIGGFAVSVPALPGCFSQGATREEALANIQEAIALSLGVMQRDGEEFPADVSPILAKVDAEPATPRAFDLDSLLAADSTRTSGR